MKVLLTGGKGMLGRTLCSELREFEMIPTDLPEADITDAAGFDAVCRAHHPDVVIHCAAMTAVDKCETEKELAWKLNAVGSTNVAATCHRQGIRLIAMSTDYVFSGDAQEPYTEFDTPNGGINVYGQSKWAGEQAIRTHCPNHIIARISWLYGQGGPSFVHTMLRLGLREILLRPELVGTFHLTCEGEASWYEFACKIFEIAGNPQKVIPCTSDEYKTPARRPANSCLKKKMLRLCGLPPMPHWESALKELMCSNL